MPKFCFHGTLNGECKGMAHPTGALYSYTIIRSRENDEFFLHLCCDLFAPLLPSPWRCKKIAVEVRRSTRRIWSRENDKIFSHLCCDLFAPLLLSPWRCKKITEEVRRSNRRIRSREKFAHPYCNFLHLTYFHRGGAKRSQKRCEDPTVAFGRAKNLRTSTAIFCTSLTFTVEVQKDCSRGAKIHP